MLEFNHHPAELSAATSHYITILNKDAITNILASLQIKHSHRRAFIDSDHLYKNIDGQFITVKVNSWDGYKYDLLNNLR